MQYMIVEAESHDVLEGKVCKLLDAEWERKSYEESATEWVFYQAMKR